jgi:N-acetylglucosaminyldiphosphoundecaprenol N-acetyl-beta-D-mannosaminyltransferase
MENITILKTGRVIGLPVSVGSTDGLVNKIIKDACTRRGGYVCAANVHMITTAKHDVTLRKVMEHASLIAADGMPLVWVLQRRGFREAERVTGTDLTFRLCERTADEGIPVGFYGSSPETIRALQKSISARFPALKIAIFESPPPQPMHPEVDTDVVNRINESGAQIIFVGLGCPKQEFWMAAYTSQLSAVLIGVGAAFDFIAGTVKRAPSWMQGTGLEWLYRLLIEPRKTWKRYVTTNPIFIWLVLKEYIRMKIGNRRDLD